MQEKVKSLAAEREGTALRRLLPRPRRGAELRRRGAHRRPQHDAVRLPRRLQPEPQRQQDRLLAAPRGDLDRPATGRRQRRADVHVAISNEAPPYDLPVRDPRSATRRATSARGSACSSRASPRSRRSRSTASPRPTVHVPEVRTVTNRNFVQRVLPAGRRAVRGPSTCATDAPGGRGARPTHDDLPARRRPAGHGAAAGVPPPRDLARRLLPHRALPDGWRATSDGARFDGPITTTEAWGIPLARG